MSTSLKGKEQANQSKHILSDHPLIKYFHRDKRDRFQDGSAPQEKQVSEWFDEDGMWIIRPLQSPGLSPAAIIQTPNEGE